MYTDDRRFIRNSARVFIRHFAQAKRDTTFYQWAAWKDNAMMV